MHYTSGFSFIKFIGCVIFFNLYRSVVSMIDAHCHLQFRQFEGEREEVLEKSRKRLKGIVTSCADVQNLEKVKEISDRDFVF
ncbi:MAG: TatD family hydrolase, partial [Candidatus Aenigmatarchaeota archaeon]